MQKFNLERAVFTPNNLLKPEDPVEDVCARSRFLAPAHKLLRSIDSTTLSVYSEI